MNLMDTFILFVITTYFLYLIYEERQKQKILDSNKRSHLILLKIHKLREIKIVLLYVLLFNMSGIVLAILILIEIMITKLFHKYINIMTKENKDGLCDN